MKIVVDANILFSALLKQSLTRKLIINSNLELVSPDFLLEEYHKYEEYILRKTRLEKYELRALKDILFRRIRIVSKSKYRLEIKEAKNISPDRKDVPYLALALSLDCPIWSNDKKLKEQNKIKIISTSELMEST